MAIIEDAVCASTNSAFKYISPTVKKSRMNFCTINKKLRCVFKVIVTNNF